ncbi:MAG TPA: cytochrome P450, partial [Dehalococcoidia bacterium]|nr:cytochrome P450 [Dehalococcoidia bacterium]
MVDEILEGVQGKGLMDIMADLAIPLPGVVISDMLGVPEEDRPQFKKWSDVIFVGLTESDSTGTQAQRFAISQKSLSELSDYFRGVVERLRGHPQDNLLSAVVEAEEAGDKLTQEELFANCVLLMFTGQETTTN